jgi:hypothetical protein
VPIIGLSKSTANDLGAAMKKAITTRPRIALVFADLRMPVMVERVIKLRLCEFFPRVLTVQSTLDGLTP